MRLTVPLLVALMTVTAAPGGAALARQETETPSSRPAPGPGAPTPPLAAPSGGAAIAGAPDRSAAAAAVRAQCAADRARLCRGGDGQAATACLAAAFAKLSSDCQAAVTALRQARTERGG